MPRTPPYEKRLFTPSARLREDPDPEPLPKNQNPNARGFDPEPHVERTVAALRVLIRGDDEE